MPRFATFQGQTPYLSVWDIISLGWLYYPIISLIFVAFSLWIAARSASAGVQDAKNALMAACGATEKAATVAASLPRYLAQSTNDELNVAIRDSLAASHEALNMVLTILEAIVGYVIDSFKSLQLCLLQFIVRGSLAVLIEFSQLTTQYLGTVLNGLADGIQSSMTTTTSAANSAIDAINSVINTFNAATGVINSITNIIPCFGIFCRRSEVESLVSRASDIPHISIGFDVSTIRTFSIPSTFTDQLIALNSSIPTLDQIRDDLINTPFDLIRGEMNTTFAGIGTPNVSVPIPAVQDIEFCSSLDTGFIDEIGDDLVKIAYIGIGVLVAIAIIIFVVNGFLVWIRWKLMNRHVDAVQERWSAGHASDVKQPVMSEKEAAQAKATSGTTQLTPQALLTLDNELSHSFAYKILDIVDKVPFIHLSPVGHDRLAWFLSYIFAPSALVCFLVGLFGILAICIQLLAIKPIQRKVDEEVEKVVQLVISSVGGKINTAVASDSQTFAAAVNGQLNDIDTAINGQLFGWISSATSALNNTLVGYYDDLQNGINSVFGSTILASPMDELIHCIIGSKIEALEGAVDYLHANLHIPIPRVSPDILLLSNNTLAEVSNPIADAAVGGGDGGVFGLLVDRYLEALKSELITFGIILGVWGFIVLMGLGILFWDLWQSRGKKDKTVAIVHDKSETEATAADQPVRPSWWQRFSTNRTLTPATLPAEDLEKGGDSNKLDPKPSRTDEETTTAAHTPSPTAEQATVATHEAPHAEETH